MIKLLTEGELQARAVEVTTSQGLLVSLKMFVPPSPVKTGSEALGVSVEIGNFLVLIILE